MNNFEVIAIISLGLDILLLILFLFLLYRIKSIDTKNIDTIITKISEIQKLTKELQELLDEKARLTDELKKTIKLKGKEGVSTGTKEIVLKLHQKGLTPAEIAQQTNLTMGEIELILSLPEN